MKAAIFEEFKAPLKIDNNFPDPECGPKDAVLKIEANGVCRSDWHLWQGHWEWMGFSPPLPVVLGHRGLDGNAGPLVLADLSCEDDLDFQRLRIDPARDSYGRRPGHLVGVFLDGHIKEIVVLDVRRNVRLEGADQFKLLRFVNPQLRFDRPARQLRVGVDMPAGQHLRRQSGQDGTKRPRAASVYLCPPIPHYITYVEN